MSLIDELKEISIVSFLTSQGFKISKTSNNKAWYQSPIRGGETKPSFVVYLDSNRWCDMGVSMRSGDIIDLVQELQGCTKSEAMSILGNGTQIDRFEPIDTPNEPNLSVVKVLDRYIDARLIMYLNARRIPESIYNIHTREIHYAFRETPDKIYSGVGFKNDEGGWELRSQVHKYATSPKAITTINNDGCVLNLYEGFINYFSSLVYFGVERMEGTTIVLNGLGMIWRILKDLNKYEKINLFLDWGQGGSNTTDLIRSVVGADKCYDHRYLYKEDEDFNDLIIRLNK